MIIGGDGKEYGPVSGDQIRAWMAAGRANLDTQAKAAGTDDWRRLAEFAEFSAGGGVGAPPTMAAGIPTESHRVTGPVDIATFADGLKARAGTLDVFSCLGRSFDLWKANFGRLVGATLLVMVVQMGMSLIPILGPLLGIFLNGVFYGGIYYYYLGVIRGEHREIGDAFAGFSKAFVPLMLTSLLMFGLLFALVVPILLPWILTIIKAVSAGATNPPPPSAGMLLGLGFTAVLGIYLSIAWVFGFVLVIDKGLGPWTALEVSRRVVTHQWFRVFFVMLLGTILAMLGMIGFFIGVLVTLPLMFGAMLYAYEDLCNPPAQG